MGNFFRNDGPVNQRVCHITVIAHYVKKFQIINHTYSESQSLKTFFFMFLKKKANYGVIEIYLQAKYYTFPLFLSSGVSICIYGRKKNPLYE